MSHLEKIPCPYCKSLNFNTWAKENGYTAVRCTDCQFIYVNPRPVQDLIDEAVKTGSHSDKTGGKNVVTKRVAKKTEIYEDVFKDFFIDIWNKNAPISWLDVGAGFGEIVEAVNNLAEEGSKVVGIEPMKPKADQAKARGLDVREQYLSDVSEKFDFLSLVNVFSHIPDFKIFLEEIKNVLNEGGEIFMETGNTADLTSFGQVPSELALPDHLVFAGEKHLIGFLEKSGFEIIKVHGIRRDDFFNFVKSIVKKLLGRKIPLGIPYTSPYRQLYIRAKLVS